MDRESLVEQVRHLRQEGQSIRSIASQLAIHPSRVQRMLKSLGHRVIPSSDFLIDQWVPQPNRGAEVFVGRHREMGQLQSALEDAISSWGRLVMLVGEPGIGKTHTAQELASRAETRGAQVLWGWCYEEGGALPFWPWVQPIRSYVQRTDSAQLRSEMGPGAADIAEAVGEIHRKLPHLEPPPALEPEHARFRLFDSITTFLKSAAQSQPLMLVLDDLHWADKPSLLLLEFLARQLATSRLLVVGCYRDAELSRQHPLSDTLAQLSRLPVFQRVLLRGMGREDTSHFIETIAGVQPPQRLVESIYAHTEGNPFFMKEMTRLVSERGDLTAEIGGPEGIRVPEGVREVIGQRLNRLSEQCNQTLTVASVIGKQFEFQLLKKLNDELTEEQLLEVIDEAIDAHLIEAGSGGKELYQFSHTLVQQALSEELSTSRRVRLHARIGQTLEGLYGHNASLTLRSWPTTSPKQSHSLARESWCAIRYWLESGR
jgi:predicted ATPase